MKPAAGTMSHMASLMAFDHALRAWIVAHRLGALDTLMWGLSVVGRGGVIWVLLAIALAAFGRLRRSALLALFLALVLATVMADYVFKPMVHRTRPFVDTPSIAVIGGRPDDPSFPSGHAANAFAGALVLSVAADAPALMWWMLAAAIAYSRVYLGVHYPLDVAGGALVGLAAGAASVAFWRPRVILSSPRRDW